MNLIDLLNQVADDADATVMADPVEIRRTGDRRAGQVRRNRALIVAAAAALIAGVLLQIRVGQNTVDPAPPVPPEPPAKVTYMNGDGISFLAPDGSRHTLRAKNVDRFAFSPNGQKVAYITYNTGANWLWLADADGTHRDRQPAPCAGCMPGYGLTWSNDGTRLAYSVFTPGNQQRAQLRIQTIGTGKEIVYRMPRGCDARGPRFSPDDQTLAINLSCEDGAYETGQYVATLDPDLGTSSLTRLTHGYSQVQLPSWSPDGELVYFTATTSGNNSNDTAGTGDLFAVAADGTGLRQITHAAPGERYVAPTRYHDKFLINRAYRTGPWKVGWLSSAGTTFTPIKDPDGKPVLGNQPELQP
jgi:WD40-like Beta Propeller Repeat